ncbi:MAG TPA: zinc ribbon domain-containing protein [Fimbriimonadaceae bacterium]|nr:zinc ribbon domain-containing protein [Fimbriimonadaceae bacterium]
MPIYEYELLDGECQMCPGRFEVLQGADEEPLVYCPGCGLPCKRVVSRVSFSIGGGPDPEKAAKRGFTTWKRAKKGEWEKVAGPGVDAIVSTDDDRRAIEEEQQKPKVVDLDDD